MTYPHSKGILKGALKRTSLKDPFESDPSKRKACQEQREFIGPSAERGFIIVGQHFAFFEVRKLPFKP